MRPPRHVLGAGGIALVAVGLAQRMAFFTWPGLVLVVAGFALIAAAATRPADDSWADVVYPPLFAGLAVTAALAPFRPGSPDTLVATLTLAAPAAFYAMTAVAGLRRLRLYVAAGCLIAAHAVFILEVPSPEHQDVYRFLNLGVDALVAGHDPYGPIPAALGGPFKFTYPPAVLLLVGPFRLLLGDVRWAYIAAEAVATLTLARLLRQYSPRPRLLDGGLGAPRARHEILPRWQEALILTPLALPRVSQGFYVFSNHEWVLLALALLAVALALRPNWVAAGVALGLGIGAKQYFLLFPALFLLPVVRRRSLVLGAALAALIALPFAAWDARDFFVNVFGNLGLAPDPERLTLWAALSHAGLNPGRVASLGLAAMAAVGTLALLVRSRRDLSASLLACGLALAVVSLCSTFAAYNYYAYALAFCVYGLVIPAGWERRRPAEPPSPADKI